jgi:hypothetical protein
MRNRISVSSSISDILQNVEQLPQLAPSYRHTVPQEDTDQSKRRRENHCDAEPAATARAGKKKKPEDSDCR